MKQNVGNWMDDPTLLDDKLEKNEDAMETREDSDLCPEPVRAAEKLSFEEAMTQIERMATEMASEHCGLDQAMQLFERSQELLRFCQKRLDESEQKIRILTESMEEDNFNVPEE